MATKGAPEPGVRDEPSSINAIVVVPVVLSENRPEMLVRTAYRVDGCGGSRDAAELRAPLR